MDRKVNTLDSSRTSSLNEALELFHFAYRAFTSGPDRILEGRGLQRVHHRILYFVGRNPDLAVGDLVSILGVTKQALHAPLRQLLEMKLVDSQSDSQDRRIRRLRLTSEGLRLESSLSGLQRRKLESVFSKLGGETEDSWRQVMRAVAGKPGEEPT